MEEYNNLYGLLSFVKEPVLAFLSFVSLYWGLRNVEYSLLVVMSELSTVRCDRVLGLWLQVHERRVSTESCRGRAQVGRQL